jgi:hypothetical protein
MSIVRWAYPSLLENAFKNWVMQHDIISTWSPIIKHLKGENATQSMENNAGKDLAMLQCILKEWRRIQRKCTRLQYRNNVNY